MIIANCADSGAEVLLYARRPERTDRRHSLIANAGRWCGL